MIQKEIIVPPNPLELRLDFFLARELAQEFSRTKIKQMIEEGHILLNGKAIKPHTKVVSGDKINLSFTPVPDTSTRAENIPLNIVYEDEDLIVVNKPVGMVVHPACGNPSGTLVNALLHHSKFLSSVGGMIRPGIVHRLDKDTSGLLVVAKNDNAHRLLGEQFKHHKITRVYWVAVKGVVQHDEMRSNEPLGRSVQNRKKVVVQEEGGRPSATNFKVLKRYDKATLLEARPETGRTHQIRVHLQALGYPVLGDMAYGVSSQWIKRQALHAKKLGFTHPRTKEKLIFDSDLPDDMQNLLKHL